MRFTNLKRPIRADSQTRKTQGSGVVVPSRARLLDEVDPSVFRSDGGSAPAEAAGVAEPYREEVPPELLRFFGGSGRCDADCDPPQIRGNSIVCPVTLACDNIPSCDCDLFRLDKSWQEFDQDQPWEQMGSGAQYQPTRYYYRCWCAEAPWWIQLRRWIRGWAQWLWPWA